MPGSPPMRTSLGRPASAAANDAPATVIAMSRPTRATSPPVLTASLCPGGVSSRRRVLQNPAQITETDRRVHPLGHRRGLQARGRAPAITRPVQLGSGQRGAEPTPAGLRRGTHVVDPAVAAEVVGQ